VALTLTSPSFNHSGTIPNEFTCDGRNVLPELNWSDAPDGTESFVMICNNTDVPEDCRDKVPDLIWVHFVLFNIPSFVRTLSQGMDQGPRGSICGLNSWGYNNYRGPCPPHPKHHRYFFKLYALDTKIDLKKSAGKKDVLQAMKNHVLSEVTLMGCYLRQQFQAA